MPENLFQMLQNDFELSPDQINWGLKQTQGMPSNLPMILWRYGLINLSQLDQLLDHWA